MYLRAFRERNFNPFRQSLCSHIILYETATDDKRLGFALCVRVIQAPAHSVLLSANATRSFPEEQWDKHLTELPLQLSHLSHILKPASTSWGYVLGRTWRNRSLPVLLPMRMQNGTAAVENSPAAPPKVKYRLTMWPNNLTLGYTPNGNENVSTQELEHKCSWLRYS